MMCLRNFAAPRRRGLLLCALLTGMLLHAVPLAAAGDAAAEVPQTSEIERELSRLQEDTELDVAVREQAVARLQRAIDQRNELERLRSDIRSFNAEMRAAPARTAELEAAADAFDPAWQVDAFEEAAPAEIETEITRLELALTRWRRELSTIEQNVLSERSADLEQEIARARESVEDEPGAAGGGKPGRAEALAMRVSRALQHARLEALEQQQLSRPARLAVRRAEAALLELKISDAEKRLRQLRRLAAEHRQNEAERRAERARETFELLRAEPEPVIDLAARVVALAETRRDLVAKSDFVIAQLDRISRERSRLEQRFVNLGRQLDYVQIDASPAFGAALREQRDELINFDRAVSRLERFERELTASRLEQFRLDGLLDQSEHQRLAVELAAVGAAADVSLTLDMKRLVRDLVGDEYALQQALLLSYTEYVDALVRLTEQFRGMITQNREYATLLDQHLLWLPSANGVGRGTVQGLAASFSWFADPGKWSELGTALGTRLRHHLFAGLLGFAVLILLLRHRRELAATLAAMDSRVGKVQFDTTRLTFAAIALTAGLALPGPFILWGGGELLAVDASFAHALALALQYGAAVYFVLAFVRHSAVPGGLAERHFNWPSAVVATLRRQLPWFMAVFIPAVILNLFLDGQASAAVRDSLGRGAFLLAALVLALFLWRLNDPVHGMFPRPPDSDNGAATRSAAALFAVLVPVLVAALSAYGYHYTAVQLATYLMNSTLVVLGGVYAFSFLQRAFAVSERRLTLERLRARRAAAFAKNEEREAALASGDAVPDKLDIEEIDLQTISSQTRALLKMLVLGGVAIGLWHVWSDFAPAFKPLENVVLWDVAELVDGVPIAAEITLWDFLLAVLIAVITVLGAKNIPGSLEVAVLRRLSLEAGTSYAITTISRYIIVIVGSVVALQILGAQWSKLQWLVAALSVGLGFGLQEIVANFVSGIVILFERPIRIGDTVTVGDQWGTVSRIRIRATTIVDWDRREIVIPNKTFITERLVNWTLTDPITRVVVKVGVAYGSDVDLTERLLLELAEANERVLKEPPPVAVFLNFGDSSLDFELRIFVRGVHELIPVRHELNTAIDAAFREHDIEISFPQRDLHLDDHPIEIRLVDGPRNDAD